MQYVLVISCDARLSTRHSYAIYSRMRLNQAKVYVRDWLYEENSHQGW